MKASFSTNWIEEYRKLGALWIHDGNPKRPHALLTGDDHSSGFFNSRLVIPHEDLLRTAAVNLVDWLALEGDLDEEDCDESKTVEPIILVDRVVGPQTGATKLAELLSIAIGEFRGRPCAWASPAKVGEGKDKRMVFDDPTRKVFPGERVLLCEDVLTTGDSVNLAATVCIAAGGTVLHDMLVLVNRSGLMGVHEKHIIALVDRHMPKWKPEECPLCKQGSVAIRPKEAANWAALNAEY